MLLVFVVSVVVVHGGALDDPFHYDDHHSLVNPAARDLRNIALFFTDSILFFGTPGKGDVSTGGADQLCTQRGDLR
mgnify:CR=1 FL=1